MLRIFVEAGAPEEILYDARPHLGTDLLVKIVENMRNRILEAGGTVRFRTKVQDLLTQNGRIRGVRTADGEEIAAEAARSGNRAQRPRYLFHAFSAAASDAAQIFCRGRAGGTFPSA